jgi:hypothetical protein
MVLIDCPEHCIKADSYNHLISSDLASKHSSHTSTNNPLHTGQLDLASTYMYKSAQYLIVQLRRPGCCPRMTTV